MSCRNDMNTNELPQAKWVVGRAWGPDGDAGAPTVDLPVSREP
jgi:hypothetical protein